MLTWGVMPRLSNGAVVSDDVRQPRPVVVDATRQTGEALARGTSRIRTQIAPTRRVGSAKPADGAHDSRRRSARHSGSRRLPDSPSGPATAALVAIDNETERLHQLYACAVLDIARCGQALWEPYAARGDWRSALDQWYADRVHAGAGTDTAWREWFVSRIESWQPTDLRKTLRRHMMSGDNLTEWEQLPRAGRQLSGRWPNNGCGR